MGSINNTGSGTGYRWSEITTACKIVVIVISGDSHDMSPELATEVSASRVIFSNFSSKIDIIYGCKKQFELAVNINHAVVP